MDPATTLSPGSRNALKYVQLRKPHAFRLRDDGATPNNQRFPLIIYRSAIALPLDGDPAAIFETIFKSNGWTDSWRDGIYDFLHFHTRTHEVLGIAKADARVRFGGKGGRTIAVTAGDVIVLPAGTGHQRIDGSGELLVVGAYPKGSAYDEPRPDQVDPAAARRAIAAVPPPLSDPLYGPNGPLVQVWR